MSQPRDDLLAFVVAEIRSDEMVKAAAKAAPSNYPLTAVAAKAVLDAVATRIERVRP